MVLSDMDFFSPRTQSNLFSVLHCETIVEPANAKPIQEYKNRQVHDFFSLKSSVHNLDLFLSHGERLSLPIVYVKNI